MSTGFDEILELLQGDDDDHGHAHSFQSISPQSGHDHDHDHDHGVYPDVRELVRKKIYIEYRIGTLCVL
jgi:hypothetical protein